MKEPMPEAEELQAALKEASKDVMVTSYNFEMFLDAVEFLSGGDAGRAKIAEKWPGADYGTVAVVRANGRGLREGTYFTSPVTALQTGKHGVTIVLVVNDETYDAIRRKGLWQTIRERTMP